jgi:hypothetical protein
MNEKEIEIMIRVYNQLFDDYTRQMVWLADKNDFSQAKRHIIAKDISKRCFNELCRLHLHLLEVCGIRKML